MNVGRDPRFVKVSGKSGSGKTTLLVQLIRHYVARGERIGAVKHTHHPLNEENRGDTARFREAGADPVILAGEGEAVVFRGSETSRIRYASAQELLDSFDTDRVFIEGFKDLGGPTIEELIQILDRIGDP